MLSEYPVVVDVVVRWGDMDALGHVTNSVYLQYFEIARIAYMERAGTPVPRIDLWDYGFIVAATSCRYRAPVTYPDTLSVGARVSALGADRFVMEYAALSHKVGRVAADGDALVVSYDYAVGRRTPLRADYRAAIIALEGSEPPTLPPRSRRTRSSE